MRRRWVTIAMSVASFVVRSQCRCRTSVRRRCGFVDSRVARVGRGVVRRFVSRVLVGIGSQGGWPCRDVAESVAVACACYAGLL
ncbi:hypothetical protein EDB89DRAFT_829248 [Lactarius sanguifluus]|nr:hypothetical protein EDB89DRAFT_829248 [Lactarius sanguifluus]